MNRFGGASWRKIPTRGIFVGACALTASGAAIMLHTHVTRSQTMWSHIGVASLGC